MIVFYFLVGMMPMDQYHLWGMFIGAGTIIKYVGIVCVLYAVFHLAARRTAPHYLKTLQARAFLLFLPLTFTSYWVMGPKFSLQSSVFMSCLSIAFLFFVVLTVVDTTERLRWTLLTAVGSMGLTSVYVFREWLRDPMWRPGSISGDANYFALNACLVLPVAYLLVFHSRVFWERIFAFGCMGAIIVSNGLGASRGGLFGLVAAFLWLTWHSRRRVRNFVLICILITPPVFLLPSSPLRRLIHPQWSDLTGEKNRLIAWQAGLRMIEHRPLTGIGLGQFKPKMPNYTDPGVTVTSIAHNTYIEVAAENGLPTFLVFTAMLVFTYLSLSRVRRQTAESGPPLLHLAATGIQAGYFGYLVGAFFLSAEYQKLFWLWVFLAMSLPALIPVSAQERGSGSPYAARQREKWEPLPGRASALGQGTGLTPQAAATSRRSERLSWARHEGAVRKPG